MQFLKKTMKKTRKKRIHRNFSNQKKNYLVSEPNFNTRNFLSANLLAIEMKKAQILLNKLV